MLVVLAHGRLYYLSSLIFSLVWKKGENIDRGDLVSNDEKLKCDRETETARERGREQELTRMKEKQVYC